MAPLFSDKGKQKHIISFGVLCHGDGVWSDPLEGTLTYYFDSLL